MITSKPVLPTGIDENLHPIWQQLLCILVGRALHRNCKNIGSIRIGGPDGCKFFLAMFLIRSSNSTPFTLDYHLPIHPIKSQTVLVR